MLIANFDDILIVNFHNVSSVEKSIHTGKDGVNEHQIIINEVGRPEPRVLAFDNIDQLNQSWEMIKKLYGANAV